MINRKPKLVRQLQTSKVNDLFFAYLIEQDSFLTKELSERIEHLMRSYAYLESLIKRNGSV